MVNIRIILESFLKDYDDDKTFNNFQNKLNKLNNDYELIHDSLMTIINYFSLQQNAIRALLSIEAITQEKNIKLQEINNLQNGMRMLILPQIEIFLYNLKSAVKSKDRVLNYLQKSPIQRIPELVKEMVEMDRKFLDITTQEEDEIVINLLEQSIQSLLMSHLDNSGKSIEKMLKHLENPSNVNQDSAISSLIEESEDD
jgi:hypothetical protein